MLHLLCINRRPRRSCRSSRPCTDARNLSTCNTRSGTRITRAAGRRGRCSGRARCRWIFLPAWIPASRCACPDKVKGLWLVCLVLCAFWSVSICVLLLSLLALRPSVFHYGHFDRRTDSDAFFPPSVVLPNHQARRAQLASPRATC